MSLNTTNTILGGYNTGLIVVPASDRRLPLPSELHGEGLYVIRLRLQNSVEGAYLVSLEKDEGRRVSVNIIINSNIFPATAITNQMTISSIDSGMPSVRLFTRGADGEWRYVKNGGGNNPVSFNFKKIKTIFS